MVCFVPPKGGDDLLMHPRDILEYTQGIRYFIGVPEQRAIERFQQYLEPSSISSRSAPYTLESMRCPGCVRPASFSSLLAQGQSYPGRHHGALESAVGA